MTDAQTEARAIALAAAGQVHDNEDARCVETLVEKLVATALAAKDAELAIIRGELNDCASEIHDLRAQIERAEAQLAEARIDAEAQRDEALKAQRYLNDGVFVGLPDQEIARRARLLVEATRRALTGGGDD